MQVINGFSLIQIFNDNSEFICHEATQNCLDDVFFHSESLKKTAKPLKIIKVNNKNFFIKLFF